MATPPARTEISDTYPNPSDAVARTGFGKLWDYVTTLLGATGNASDARAALGVAAYEPPGVWTPTDASGAGITYSSALGRYIEYEDLVWIGGGVTYPVNAGGAALAIGGLPFPAISGFAQSGGAWIDPFSAPTMGVLDSGATNLKVRNLATGANVISSQAGGLSVYFNLLYLKN